MHNFKAIRNDQLFMLPLTTCILHMEGIDGKEVSEESLNRVLEITADDFFPNEDEKLTKRYAQDCLDIISHDILTVWDILDELNKPKWTFSSEKIYEEIPMRKSPLKVIDLSKEEKEAEKCEDTSNKKSPYPVTLPSSVPLTYTNETSRIKSRESRDSILFFTDFHHSYSYEEEADVHVSEIIARGNLKKLIQCVSTYFDDTVFYLGFNNRQIYDIENKKAISMMNLINEEIYNGEGNLKKCLQEASSYSILTGRPIRYKMDFYKIYYGGCNTCRVQKSIIL